MWKVIGWVLAAIGAVVVVRKAAPWVARQVRQARHHRALPQGREPHLLPSGQPESGRGPKLVSCGLGGSPAPAGEPKPGFQSSALFRWCYVVRAGDSAGSIAEAITGDSSRYTEVLVANPSVPKRGKMGVVVGPDAWDFDGSLPENSTILISQTMNAWVDQVGVAKGGYLPYPPDPRAMAASEAGGASSEPAPRYARDPEEFPPPPDMSDEAAPSTASAATSSGRPAWGDGFDYLGGV